MPPDWFVVNARDAQWLANDAFCSFVAFERPGERFEQIGIAIGVLEPGKPNALYHAENAQEDFLVLSGECVLRVEGEERALRAWDFVHLPPGTPHVFVGAGEGPCVVVAVGARFPSRTVRFPEQGTDDPEEAYAGTGPFRSIDCPL